MDLISAVVDVCFRSLCLCKFSDSHSVSFAKRRFVASHPTLLKISSWSSNVSNINRSKKIVKKGNSR